MQCQCNLSRCIPGNERAFPAKLLLYFKMADKVRSPAKKRRKTGKKDSDRNEEIEEQEQSIKRTGKTEKMVFLYDAYVVAFEIQAYILDLEEECSSNF